ncbi:serine protease grass-like [Drosophila nasuta]|uniref:serine protease grass-like n=1 Tax=Drosophila nasuta TaxID=42062 RepID=UPI00295F1635|nr:serine protease grass-like [Drosophila nasuta]
MLRRSGLLLVCAIFCWQNSLAQELNQNGRRLLEEQNCGTFSRLKIVNGHEVRLGSRPWMALLLLSNGREQEYACGGTLINERFVLTAAHCVSRFQLVSVRLGEHQLSTEPDCRNIGRKEKCAPPVEDIEVEKIFKHENYVRLNGHNDIALIKLSRAVVFSRTIRPICLPTTDVNVNENFLVTGWGKTENQTLSDVLREANIKLRNPRTCQQSFRREIAQSQLCVGDVARDSCRGDSGGPLSYPAEYLSAQRFVQFGIVSYGAFECGSGYPGVYTKVASFIPWITNILGTNS